jgi:kynurenine formamidase
MSQLVTLGARCTAPSLSVLHRLRVLGAGWLALALLAFLGACAPASDSTSDSQSASAQGSEAAADDAREPRPPLDLTGVQVVDLTYAYDENTLYWPTSPSAFELEQLHYGPVHGGTDQGGYFYSANSFCTPEHGGTHLDAPIHFGEGHQTADEIPLHRLMGPAVVVDVSEQAAQDPDYRLTAEDVAAWESAHGPVPEGALVLLRTGWGERWPDRLRYFGDDAPGDASNLHFPSYGEDAARILVEERGVAALGVDTASLDYGPSTDFIVHQVAAASDVAGLENVAHLDQLPATGAWVIALPMKIAGGSGGPVRIVALVPEST